MDRRIIPAIESKDSSPRHSKAKKKTRTPKGLEIKERRGHWHIYGSLLVGKRTIRIRRTTGLLATVENWEAADSIRDKIKEQARNEIIYGKKEDKLLIEAASLYLKQKKLRKPDRYIIIEISMHLGVDWQDYEDNKNAFIDKSKKIDERLSSYISSVKEAGLQFRSLREIEEDEWQQFIDQRHESNTPQTRQRYINIVMPFLNWCFEKKWLDTCPKIQRSISESSKSIIAKRRVNEITFELIQMMVEHATWHLKPQIAVEWSTGGRVSSVLCQVRRCDVILENGHEQIQFCSTKNGEPVICALHPWAAKIIEEYKVKIDQKLASKGEKMGSEDQFFRDWQGRPYTYNKDRGGASNKTAFNKMKKRVIKALKDQNRYKEAELMQQFTQHWFRHRLATTLNKNGADIRTIMEQGGWKTPAMVLHYTHDVPEKRRAFVANMDVDDTYLTHDKNKNKRSV